jgi:hypothetical protein
MKDVEVNVGVQNINTLKVVTNEKGEAVGKVVTIIC